MSGKMAKKDEMYYFFFSSFQCHIFLNDSKQLSTYILSPYRTYGCISIKRATIWKTKCSNRSQPRPAVCDISKSGSDEEIQALCPAACIYVLMSRWFVSRVSNPLFYPLFSYLPPSLDPSHVFPLFFFCLQEQGCTTRRTYGLSETKRSREPGPILRLPLGTWYLIRQIHFYLPGERYIIFSTKIKTKQTDRDWNKNEEKRRWHPCSLFSSSSCCLFPRPAPTCCCSPC